MSHREAAEYEILGFSLFGPPPVGSVYFPWNSGLNVLYGANGAGKTSILRSLESAITGVAIPDATSMMHIRAHPRFAPRPPRTARQVLRDSDDHKERPAPTPSGLVEAILNGVYDEVAHDVRLAPGRGDYAFDTDPERVFEYHDRLMGDPVDRVAALAEAFCGNLSSATEIAVEVSQQLCFTLIAAGTTERPAWKVNVSVARSSETPAVNALASWIMESDHFLYGDDEVFFDWRVHARRYSQSLVLQENAPMPIVRAGTVRVLRAGFVRVEELRESAVDRPRLISELDGLDIGIATAEALDTSPSGLFATTDDSGWTLAVNDEVPEILGEIERAANHVLSRLLLDAPELSVSITDPPTDWLSRPVVDWKARDRYAGDWVSVSQLSEAQRRWAELAVQVALVARLDADRPAVAIIDEPEQALHRLAMKQAVEGLGELGGAGIGPVIVASHSAEFLNAKNARLVHVRRLPDGSADARVMERATGDSVFKVLENTGGRADLLLGTRAWLIVEGQHDKVVVETLIGDELEQTRTRVVAIAGTPNLSSVIDSQFLFDYTDVATVIALDRTSSPHLFKLWKATLKMCEGGDYRRAREHAGNANLEGFTKEELVAYRFLVQAIHAGRLDRIHLFGFKKPDILYYLPVNEFVSDATSWEDLTHQRQRTPDGGLENVKAVIKRRSGQYVSVRRVEKAAHAMDQIPREFTELLGLCRQVSGVTNE